ncbi:MAG: acyl-CoA/acyl-ACP dehydrogenase [Deltaproteobacteria bacterium]|nr:acyl-CoA/acyl-ACP dehydrogenase [Deltaproteobacteria bacterium]MBW2419821.1 acyl-CoA/acyl-ACP dehydrogenase [Deltaproteobacteria bacterium]
MDLDFTEEQTALREMVRDLCRDHASLDTLRTLEDDPKGYAEGFWKVLGEVDLLGLTLPEAYGGMGQGLLEAVVVYEEFGRVLAPSPHFVSSILAGGLLARAGSEEQKREWLPRIVSGEAILTPAWLEPERGFAAKGVQLRARRDGDAFVLSGSKRYVHFASAATRLVVLARTGDADEDLSFFLVDPAAEGLRLTQQLSLASDTQYRVAFDDVRVPAASAIGGVGAGWRFWHEAMLDGAVVQAALAVGGAQRSLEMTVEFSQERHQFGKPLAAFQALSHYMADASTRIDGAQLLVWEAAWEGASGHSIERLAPMAKLYAGSAFQQATRVFQQIWGGVGFTREYDIQLYFRRAEVLQHSWWNARSLKQLIAAQVLDS